MMSNYHPRSSLSGGATAQGNMTQKPPNPISGLQMYWMILCYHFNYVHHKLPFKRAYSHLHHTRDVEALEAIWAIEGQPGLRPQTKLCPGYRRASGRSFTTDVWAMASCNQDAPYLITKTGRPLEKGLTRIFVHYEPTCLWGNLPGYR